MSISMKRYNDTIITPKDDRILFDQIFDDYGLIYGGSATMAASNKIHVGAARGFIKGTEVIVEAEDIAVNLSDSGTKNGRLKIVMDLADTETPIKFESEVAASFPALEQDANINYDNGRYEVVFATYKATETTISSVALVMPTMQSVKAKIQGINQSLTNIKYVTDVNSFVNSGSAFVYSETGNKITIYCYGSVKSDLPINAILCSGFPAPLLAYSALHIINITTGEIGSCTIRQNGQLLILNNILKAGHAFCISGVYIKA